MPGWTRDRDTGDHLIGALAEQNDLGRISSRDCYQPVLTSATMPSGASPTGTLRPAGGWPAAGATAGSAPSRGPVRPPHPAKATPANPTPTSATAKAVRGHGRRRVARRAKPR